MGLGEDLFSHPFRSFRADHIVIPSAAVKCVVPLIRMCAGISELLVEQPFVCRGIYTEHFTQMSGPLVARCLTI